MSAPGRLSLADMVDMTLPTADDLVNVMLTLVEAQGDIANRVARLLQGDAGRTVQDIAYILDISVIDAATAIAHLTQAGAVFQRVRVATGESGYVLLGWA